MNRKSLILVTAITWVHAFTCTYASVTFQEHANRIDVNINGQLFTSYVFALDPQKPLVAAGHQPFVILMVGVNGVGKTTTIGKLASRFDRQNKSLLLAAGDTFRAAAGEQLDAFRPVLPDDADQMLRMRVAYGRDLIQEGRRLIGWDEIREGGLSPNATASLTDSASATHTREVRTMRTSDWPASTASPGLTSIAATRPANGAANVNDAGASGSSTRPSRAARAEARS